MATSIEIKELLDQYNLFPKEYKTVLKLRTKEMLELRLQGNSEADIAKKYKLTRGRVNEIINKGCRVLEYYSEKINAKCFMTDLEKMETLLREFGVGYQRFEKIEGKKGRIVQLLCREGNEKIGGYSFFCTTFDFDQDGKFEEMGAWEGEI